MAEYIERKAAKKVAERYGCKNGSALGRHSGLADCIAIEIDELPASDVAPVVHGRWGRCGGDLHSSGYAIFCSVCNKVHFVHRKYSTGGLTNEELFKKPNYCPSCGAVMECEE